MRRWNLKDIRFIATCGESFWFRSEIENTVGKSIGPIPNKLSEAGARADAFFSTIGEALEEREALESKTPRVSRVKQEWCFR